VPSRKTFQSGRISIQNKTDASIKKKGNYSGVLDSLTHCRSSPFLTGFSTLPEVKRKTGREKQTQIQVQHVENTMQREQENKGEGLVLSDSTGIGQRADFRSVDIAA